MREPIEHGYFNWLCAKVTRPHSRNYVDLLIHMHRTEFTWVVRADRDRAEDGIELRLDFLRATGITSDKDWEDQPCSIFEMILALADRASFQTDIATKTWFWEMLTNLKLNEYRTISGNDECHIKDILDTFIWRQYLPNGDGGLFPMSRTERDQRDVEIWYQFCEYVDDRGIL